MKTVAFLLFDKVEVLDFSGPFDVFSMASIAMRQELFKLITVSADGKPVEAIHGLRILPTCSIAECGPGDIDILIIPGGATDVIDAIEAGKHADLIDWIRAVSPKTEVTATICVGAFFGAVAGLFAERRATTHHAFLDKLADWTKDQGTTVVRGSRYVNSGANGPQIWSSAGVSAGIDLAFRLLKDQSDHAKIPGVSADQIGADVALKTQNLMEYNATTNWAAE